MIDIEKLLLQINKKKDVISLERSYLNDSDKEIIFSKLFLDDKDLAFEFKKYNITNDNKNHPYTAVGIDGSQLYPSRHEGIDGIGLLNIASVLFDYQSNPSAFSVSSTPIVVNQSDIQNYFGENEILHKDHIDCLRHIYEIKVALEVLSKLKNEQINKTLIFFDATFNLNYLASKSKHLREAVNGMFWETAKKFIQLNGIGVSFISSPNNNDLVTAVNSFDSKNNKFKQDASLLESFLPSLGDHSPVYYKADSNIGFFYINIGTEIARVEIFREQLKMANFIKMVLLEQIRLGLGYPLCLAEAHVYAEISSFEKEFFINNFFSGLHNKKYSSKNISKQLKFC